MAGKDLECAPRARDQKEPIGGIKHFAVYLYLGMSVPFLSFISLTFKLDSSTTSAMIIDRKIVDYSSVATELDAKPPQAAALKPATLTINIDTVNEHNALQERMLAARTRDSLTPRISPSLYTPNSSHTFGVPNPTSVTSSSDESDGTRKRRQRYSLAEQALAATLQNCNNNTGASTREMQIKVLEQATALLSAHAIDAQERAAKLRSHLVDREMDPEAYETLQRERWMEEKRQAAVDVEAQMLHQHLLSLTQSFEDRDRESASVKDEDRRLENLARFFQASLTRAPISSSNHPAGVSATDDRFLRRKTLDDVAPSMLRGSPLVSPRHVLGHTRSRSRSLDGKDFAPRSRERTVRLLASPVQPPLTIVTEDAPVDHPPALPSPCPSLSPSPTISDSLVHSVDGTHESMTTAVWSAVHVPTTIKDDHRWDNDVDGTVTIYQSVHAPRSNIDILSDPALQDIELPDYAKALMHNLDDIHDRIRLRPTPMQPRRVQPLFPPRSAFTPSFAGSEPPLRPFVGSPKPSSHRPQLSIDIPSTPLLQPPPPPPLPTITRTPSPPQPPPIPPIPPPPPTPTKPGRSHLSSLFSRFTSPPEDNSQQQPSQPRSPSLVSPSSKTVKRKKSFFRRVASAVDSGCRSSPSPNGNEGPGAMMMQRSRL